MPEEKVVRDKFGSYFWVEKGVTYCSFLKKFGSRYSKQDLEKKPLIRLYLTRIVKKDNKGRLYVNYGGSHVFCFNKKTVFKENDEVFVDSQFQWKDIFGVTKDGKTFETWRTRISTR